MVNFDRPFSTFTARLKASPPYRASVKAMTTAGAAVRSKAAVAGASSRVRYFTTASPRVKVLTAGAALAFITGLSAPAIAANDGPSDGNVAVAGAAGAAGASSAKDGADRDQKADRAARPAPATPAAPAPVAPTIDQLHPTGIQGSQVGFTPTTDQMRNAQKIIQAGQAMELPPRAWVIAVATSLQESTLNNYGDLGANNDHDSLGLFQQRPTSGWGSPNELQNPTYAAKAFYKALTQVHNWDKLPLTDAAQAVQVSAFPDHYAKWEAHAGDVVDSFYGHGPLAKVAKKVM